MNCHTFEIVYAITKEFSIYNGNIVLVGFNKRIPLGVELFPQEAHHYKTLRTTAL